MSNVFDFRMPTDMQARRIEDWSDLINGEIIARFKGMDLGDNPLFIV